MGKVAFNTGTRKVNRIVICQRCNTNKKLAIDKYCVRCGIEIKDMQQPETGYRLKGW